MEVAALVASIVSVVLGAYAIVLSLLFYRMTENGQREIEKASRDIAASVEKIEELFNRMYTDAFALVRDSYNNMIGVSDRGGWRGTLSPSAMPAASAPPEVTGEAARDSSEQSAETFEVPLPEREELLLRVLRNMKENRPGPITAQDLMNTAQDAGFGSWPVSEFFALRNKGLVFSSGDGLNDVVSDDRDEVTAVTQKNLEELRRRMDALDAKVERE